jgi:hypothetical protein
MIVLPRMGSKGSNVDGNRVVPGARVETAVGNTLDGFSWFGFMVGGALAVLLGTGTLVTGRVDSCGGIRVDIDGGGIGTTIVGALVTGCAGVPTGFGAGLLLL